MEKGSADSNSRSSVKHFVHKLLSRFKPSRTLNSGKDASCFGVNRMEAERKALNRANHVYSSARALVTFSNLFDSARVAGKDGGSMQTGETEIVTEKW